MRIPDALAFVASGAAVKNHDGCGAWIEADAHPALKELHRRDFAVLTEPRHRSRRRTSTVT
jgi:hypothetical protein